MGRRVLAAWISFFLVCPWSAGSDDGTAGEIDLGTAGQYFSEFQTLCGNDDGELWGMTLCGPILLVDPSTRMVVANRSDEAGVLQPRAGVFVGKLPEDVGIANTAVEWNGTRWTMLMWWSLAEDRARRLSLLAHEAFHRIQPELELVAFGELCAHLDTAEGRFWLQMEWNALQQALSAEGDARREAVADALTFRAARQARFPKAAEREIPLEIFEGLAEYTGMRLAGFSSDEVLEAISRKRESDTGFVRSFAYVSGPLYGFLLDGSGAAWRERLSSEANLAGLLAGQLELSPRPVELATRRSEVYGGVKLRTAEDDREREREERLAKWRVSLIDGPVLIVDLTQVSSGTFNPHKVFPFDEQQTVYTTRELIAEWGRLTVDDGAILEDEARGRGHVSLSGAEKNKFAGQGWSLELNAGWVVVPSERTGDFVVRRK
jgi:hypothetical protein